MCKFLTLKTSLLAALLGASSAGAVEDLSSSIYNVEVDSRTLNYLQSYMPETEVLNPAYVSQQANPNLNFIDDGDVSLTFISEGAGYLNTFGYFTYDGDDNVLGEVTVFSNASQKDSGGNLVAGDTVDIGSFTEGDNIGFWLTANGYKNPNGMTYYSLDSLNPDGERHVAIVEDPVTNSLIIGFEDLWALGDADYNDFLFLATVSPFNAIDLNNIPSGAPEASHIATLGIALAIIFGKHFRSLGVFRRRLRVVNQQLAA